MFRGKNDRFAKVINQLNKSAQKKELSKEGYRLSSDISVLRRSSMNTSQRSTKYTHNSHTLQKQQYNEQQTIQTLLDEYEVIINRNRTILKTEFIPTCKGLKYVMIYNQTLYINLSWMHSVQELQKNKLLLLYYSMQKIKRKEKPQIESLIIEFSHRNQMIKLLSSFVYIHNNNHDDDVQKVYHKLCSN